MAQVWQILGCKSIIYTSHTERHLTIRGVLDGVQLTILYRYHLVNLHGRYAIGFFIKNVHGVALNAQRTIVSSCDYNKAK